MSIKQNLLVIERLNVFNYNTSDESDRYGLKIYYDACKRYLKFLKDFKKRLEFHKGKDTTYLVHLYDGAIKQSVLFTDSIKKDEQFKLLPADKEALLFDNRVNLKNSAGTDYELLSLLYLQDFETQIMHALYIIHPVYGRPGIIPSRFYDFMIIQNNLVNEKTYSISVKNNFMYSRGLETYYAISFQSLKKINKKDTVLLNAPVTFSEDHKIYKTNAIPYEKGNYLLTLNFNYELPSGVIKVSEMKFEYELN